MSSPWLLAAASVLGPIAIGALAGRAVRGRVSGTLRSAVGAVVLLAPLLVGARVPLSIYDQLLVAALLALAFGIASSASPAARLSPIGVAVALGLTGAGGLLVDLVAEAVLPPAEARVPAPEELHLLFRPEELDFACRAMLWKPRAEEIPPGAAPLRILLGDSMVGALDVEPAQRFTHLIATGRPAERHLPISTAGIGADVELYEVEHEVLALRPAEVVLFVFLGNDGHDIDQPHACCHGDPIVDYAGGEARLRCAPRDTQVDLAEKLRAGPSPYALRVLASSSVLAERIAARWEQAARAPGAWSYTDGAPRGQQLPHLVLDLQAIAARLRAAHVSLRVVLLPPRWSLPQPAPDDPFPAVRAAVLAGLRDHGVRVWDAWDLLSDALRRDPQADWFQRQVGNPHLGVAGHALVAEWVLREVLAP